jgi:hypothetical protein
MEAIRTCTAATLVALLAIGSSCTRKDTRKVPKPRIVMVSPSTGDFRGGTRVAILTRSFEDSFLLHHPEVTIGGKPAPIDRVVNPAELYVIAPPGPPGRADVEVRSTDAAGKARCEGCYEYAYDPAAGCEFFVRPASGPPGTYVQILGHSFGLPLGEVSFNGHPATVAYWTESTIICVAPPMPLPGPVEVKVETLNGDTCVLPDGFVYHQCTLVQVVPPSGPTCGGNTVYILGADLEPDFRVWFGPVPAPEQGITVDPSGDMITCVAPPSLSGPVDVTVGRSWKVPGCTLSDGYTFVGAPGGSCSVSSISPNRGPMLGGQWVSIWGSGFDSQTGVLFGYVPAEVTYSDSTNLVCKTPPYQGPLGGEHVEVLVIPSQGDPCTSPYGYEYVVLTCPVDCAITGISPREGRPGDYVTIRGEGFCCCGEVTFGLNGPVAAVLSESSDKIQVLVPSGATGTVPVVYWGQSGCFAISCVGDCSQCDPDLCFTYR